ncbi:MAG: hypothetical protein K0R14_1772 [Burkholderiales bacterium]|jgi:hexosaminidase|nr:hypothetical protein [Burkholderiales bacterium]
MRIYNISILFIFLFITNLSFAKNKIYLANNTAAVAIISTAESSYNLKITLTMQDDFTNWDIGFFMLKVFLDPVKTPFSAQICKQKFCAPLKVDTISDKPAKSITDYLKPELSFGHITLFKPTKLFKLEDGNTYVISIDGLKNIPKNITAMPQNLFLSVNDNESIIPIKVTGYSGYDNKDGSQKHNQDNWYAFDNPSTIDSIVIPYPQKTVFMPGTTKSTAAQSVHYCKPTDGLTQCTAINNQLEGYVLQIDTTGITIYTNTIAGVFYARQTLAQLTYYYKNIIPNQTITDYPHFKYRGFMLDTVRHFFSVNDVKKILDVMAAHKLNVLHFHVGDDEGWRIQLPHYPLLTKIGSERIFKGKIGPSNLVDETYDITNFSRQLYTKADMLYKGYYTIADTRDLVAYANSRQITIIPEIEMPGHAKALKKSMPEVFFDANDQSRYFSVQGYNDSVLPICKYGSDNKFTTAINGVITDIAALFAFQSTLNYVKNEVSLSGDEVPSGVYTDYTACNSGVYKGLSGEAISHEFFKQLSNNLPEYRLSGYQQLVQSEDGIIDTNAIDPRSTGHIWQWLTTTNLPVSGFEMSGNLSRAGYPTILNFADLSYLDMRYSAKWDEPGLYWATNQGDTFSALIAGLSPDHIFNTDNILGIEGALWSELVPSGEHLFYMITPKMAGLADAAWSDKTNLNWRSLATRLGCGKTGFLAYLNKQYNIRYRGYPNGIKLEVPANKLCK